MYQNIFKDVLNKMNIYYLKLISSYDKLETKI